MKTTRDIKNKPFKSAGIEQTCFDNSLKSIIRDELPDAPADEWFTRKVMNRLPETRHRAKVSLPERICYISGAFLLVAAWIYSIMFATTNGFTRTTITIAAVLPVVTLFCISIFAVPAIKRAI